jgi:lysophospholipase L1-like esterase
MSLITEVQELAVATTSLLTAVNDAKGQLDAGVNEATQARNEAVAAAGGIAAIGEDVAALVSLAPEIEASASQAATSAAVAQAARDAALVAGPKYATEALGRSAVADGAVFMVQGSADVAAYEYRRVNAGSSTLIAAYPSAGMVEKRLGSVQGRNLMNAQDPEVALGMFPNAATGALQANANYNTSGFIPVTAGQSYTFSQKHYVCWFTAGRVFISGTSDFNNSKTQVAPAGAAFCRASAHATNPLGWSSFQVEQGTLQTAYEAYGRKLDVSTVSDRSIPGAKLQNAGITPEQVSFLKVGKNLFNKLAATIGFFLGADGTAPVANATWDYSDFIQVVPGQQLKSSHNMRFTTFYGAGKNFMAGGASADTTTITVPANVFYVRVTIYHSAFDTFQLELGAVATAYESFGYVISGPNGEQLLPPTPRQNSVDTASIQAAAVTPAKVNFLQLGKNLFNKNAVTSGFLGPSGGGITASATYFVSDFIPVTPGLQYICNKGAAGMRFTRYYDAAQQTFAGGSSVGIGSFTPPVGAAFVRVTMFASDLETFQLEQGSASTEFKPYGYLLKINSGEAIYMDDGVEPSSWVGKTWGSLGDSITDGGTWQPKVAAALGLTWTNFGVGGTKISGAGGDANAMCQDARINAMPATLDLVTVMGGTNDWAQNVALGAADSTDPTTFNGALNTMLLKLCTRFPAKRIVLMTTPYGEMYGRVADGVNNWVNAWTNNAGLTTRDYAEAVRGACKRWGVPCADVAAAAGWNTVNIRTFITDDGGLLHPNATGGGRISEVLTGALKALVPA